MNYVKAVVLQFCFATAAFSSESMIPGLERVHFGDDIKLVKQRYSLRECITQKEASYLKQNEIACGLNIIALRRMKIGNAIPLSNLTLTFRAEKLAEVIANIDYVSERKYANFNDGYNQNKSATVFVVNWLHEQYGQPHVKTSRQWSSGGHIDKRWAPSEKTIEWHTNNNHVKAIYDGRYQNSGIAIYWFSL